MLNSYLAELEKIKLLTPEEEHASLNIISRWFSARLWRIIGLFPM